MKRIKLVLVFALACLMLAGLVACGGGSSESKPQLVEVTRGDIMVSVSADGNLSLIRDRKLAFGTSGTITEIDVEQGDPVTEGQVLARLDTTSLELAVKSAELGVKAAEIDLEVAQNSYSQITYPYTYRTFALDIPESVAAISDAQRQIKEAQEVLAVGLSSDQYWQIWHNLKDAENNLVEAEGKLARGQGEDVFGSRIIPVASFWTLRAAQLQMEKAQVALDSAQNSLTSAEDQLAKAVIVAPFDGVVAKTDVKEGNILSSVNYATKTIIELIDPNRMELSADVDEIDVPSVKLGQKAIISFDALPNLQLGGEVIAICPLATEEAGLVLYEVKIDFDVPEGSGLKSGMTATADIVLDERSDVLLVPSRAIGRDSSGSPVVEVMVDGEVEERAVLPGISDSFHTEIIDGLSESETVVIQARARTNTSGGLFGG